MQKMFLMASRCSLRLQLRFTSLAAAAVIAFSTAAAAHDTAFIRYANVGCDTVLETSGPDVALDTPFVLASVGKLMTAVAVLRLVEAGQLDLDAAADDLIDAPILEGHDIRLRHLLTMTSGLPDYYTVDYLEDALANPDAVQRATVALSYAEDAPVLFEAGARFDYSNSNYVLLGLIAEKATGQSYADLMRAEVFGPAGMENSFVFGSQPLPTSFVTGHSGTEHVRSYYAADGFGDGGVIATARDLAAFYVALFDTGTLLSRESLSTLMH